ncbi:hypothetical protein, conserved [Plasmodium gonderi]|uniref:Uncharacterized protein n=1 Tax=Plasmodium gonderi TaxID=77519 RepID=A0A1Y1JJC4_PLAGO|nr:hypothetical protein, conserved [Plasmodium gonderi]GAW82606.1 hypothetical protein, conserved [Plasmodium gonderi]
MKSKWRNKTDSNSKDNNDNIRSVSDNNEDLPKEDNKDKKIKMRNESTKRKKNPTYTGDCGENFQEDNSDDARDNGHDEMDEGIISNNLIEDLLEGIPIENALVENVVGNTNLLGTNFVNDWTDMEENLEHSLIHSCKSLCNESDKNSDTPLENDISDFIIKKKIYEKNIALIEKQIQTNKLNKLMKAREGILEMLTIIKNRKLNLNKFL